MTSGFASNDRHKKIYTCVKFASKGKKKTPKPLWYRGFVDNDIISWRDII